MNERKIGSRLNAVKPGEEGFDPPSSRGGSGRRVSPHAVWEADAVTREEHEARHGHRAAVLWFTGLSGSGKSTIARAVERRLFDMACSVRMIDGDRLRHGLSGDLAFSAADRTENIRRAGEVAKLFFDGGDIVVCAFVSPYLRDRDRVRSLFPEGRFIEVFVDCSVDECARRDTKGLYARAKAGEVQLTGVSDPYEPPVNPELVVRTETESPEATVRELLRMMARRGIIPSAPDGE
jgi:bifunctional enzyme CysN/CysC